MTENDILKLIKANRENINFMTEDMKQIDSNLCLF